MKINYPKYDFLPLTIVDYTKLYFTSDTHFGHKNVIQYSNRPYDSVELMNEEFIARWNSVVPIDGVVFHLGDFSFLNASDAKKIVERLNGKIILIKGNHDKRQNIISNGELIFEKCYTQLELNIASSEYAKYRFILTHMPLEYSRMINIHGHCHGSKPKCANQIDVGVDANDYKPISFEKLVADVNDINLNVLFRKPLHM